MSEVQRIPKKWFSVLILFSLCVLICRNFNFLEMKVVCSHNMINEIQILIIKKGLKVLQLYMTRFKIYILVTNMFCQIT